MKALLFDIDGTILKCHGAGKDALVRATYDVFGTVGAMENVNFQGKTDPLILRESLMEAGFGVTAIEERTGELKLRYFEYLAENMRVYDAVLLPGITELLAALDGRDDLLVGLLTGNFREGARIKLDRFSLFHRFSFGAFGDDAPLRNDLPVVARRCILERWGCDIPYADMIVIGDTAADIGCARAVGAAAIAVGTGWVDRALLRSHNPDWYFDDLGRTDLVIDAIDRAAFRP